MSGKDNNSNSNPSGLSDADAKAKARASSGRGRATRPGASAGASGGGAGSAQVAALARLDQRVADKLAREGQPVTAPGTAGGAEAGAASPRAALESLEAAVESKATAAPAATRPGAQAVRGSDAVADPSVAKARRGAPAPAELSHFESAVQAKVTTADGGGSGTGKGLRQSAPAPQELRAMEDRVHAKVRASAGPSLAAATSSSAAGAAAVTLDQRIAAKMAANTSVPSLSDGDGGDGKPSASRGLEVPPEQSKVSAVGTVPGDSLRKAPEQAKEPVDWRQSSQRRRDGSDALGSPESAYGVTSQPDVEYGVMSSAAAGGLDGAGLAVAVAVEDDDEDMFIPSAVEYDPDAKPPMYRHRRFRLYALLAFFVVVVVSIGAAVGATLGKQNAGPDEPTMAPTTIRESYGIRTQVERLVGQDVLQDENSPYSLALDWITNGDPMQLTPEDENFIQRYTAAYFYYATSVDGPWLSCEPPEDAWTGETECLFKQLAAIFPLQYYDVPWNRWLSNITECKWAGVTCDDQGQFRIMDLSGNELSGPFPKGVVHFPYLQSLTISWTSLRGTLPSELARMQHLNTIALHYNQFTGTVPPEWYNIRSLQELNLGDNMLSGSLPTLLGNLVDIKGIYYFTNLLTGTFPTELANLDSLAYFRFSRNAFSGTVPSAIFEWRSIEELWLHRNRLTGTLATEFGLLDTLNDLRLQANPLTGTIPTEIYAMASLERLDLWDCDLTGTISPDIGQLSDHFYTFRVSGNNLTGSLPLEMANLTEISEIWIEGNDLTGTVPAALCALESAVDYTLETFSADCLVDETTGLAQISCDPTCCTTCCRADGTGCVDTGSGV